MQYLTSQEIETSEVAEFFLDEEMAETDIAICCLNYIGLPDFESDYWSLDIVQGKRAFQRVAAFSLHCSSILQPSAVHHAK